MTSGGNNFYRTMLRTCVCRLSGTFRRRDHIGSNTLKIISRLNSSHWPQHGRSPIWFIGNTTKLGWNRGWVQEHKTCNRPISETVQDSTKVTMTHTRLNTDKTGTVADVGPYKKAVCCGGETARCCCKIRTYVSKFTAASRGSPCESTASCIVLLYQEINMDKY